MAKRGFKLEALESFSGGLNFRTDQFNLASNESPDLLNVDVDPRGGVRLRKGVTAIDPNNAQANDIQGMASFYTDAGLKVVIANYGTSVIQANVYDATATWLPVTGQTARTSNSRLYGVTMNNLFYGVSGNTDTSFKVTAGLSGTNLGTNLDGSAGNFPSAQYVTVWNNFMWTGKIVEGGTAYNSRIRWSKLNDPESWVNTDWVDIDVGEHGDVITGLVPLADRLLVFKSHSVHAMYGDSSETFSLVTLSREIGSVALSSPVATPYGVFFWHDEQGLYAYNGESFVYLFDKIMPALEDNRIRFNSAPQLAWFRNRLYISLDWTEDGGSIVRRCLVYDPTLGQQGSFVMNDIDADPLHVHTPPGQAPIFLAACSSAANIGRVVKVEQQRHTDNYSGSAATAITSYFTTPWVSGKNPIVRKRWGKPRFIMDTSASGTVNVQIYKDYDKATSTLIQFDVVGRGSTSVWNTATWNTSDETGGTGVWAATADTSITDIIKLTTLGTARSIALKVNGPNHTSAWEVNGMMFTYIPRRMR